MSQQVGADHSGVEGEEGGERVLGGVCVPLPSLPPGVCRAISGLSPFTDHIVKSIH